METVAYQVIDVRKSGSEIKGYELSVIFTLPIRLPGLYLRTRLPYVNGVRPTLQTIAAAMEATISVELLRDTENVSLKAFYADKLIGTFNIG